MARSRRRRERGKGHSRSRDAEKMFLAVVGTRQRLTYSSSTVAMGERWM